MSENGVTVRTASQGSFFKVVKPFNGPKGTWNIGTYVYVQECVGDRIGTEYHVVLIRVDPDGSLPSQWIHDTSSADKFDTAVLNGTLASSGDYEKIKYTLDPRFDSLQWCKKYLFHKHQGLNQVKTLACEIYMQTEQSTDKGDSNLEENQIDT